MLTTIKGVYNQGQIILDETPTNVTEPIEVYVTFTEKKEPATKKKMEFGFGKGMVTYMSDDFNEPLEDLKDYM
jgi:hypothetical protein